MFATADRSLPASCHGPVTFQCAKSGAAAPGPHTTPPGAITVGKLWPSVFITASTGSRAASGTDAFGRHSNASDLQAAGFTGVCARDQCAAVTCQPFASLSRNALARSGVFAFLMSAASHADAPDGDTTIFFTTTFG